MLSKVMILKMKAIWLFVIWRKKHESQQLHAYGLKNEKETAQRKQIFPIRVIIIMLQC